MVTFARRWRAIAGRRLAYLHLRSGPAAVLLLHGNSSSKEVFSRQVGALARSGMSVVVPDLPGHGHSDDALSARTSYSFPGYARILSQLMVGLGYSRYRVVGWSLGGHIGIEMWANNPAVSSLLISGTPPIRLSQAGVAAGFNWTATTALAGRRLMRNPETIRYVRAMMDGPPDAGTSFLENVRRTDGDARHWMVQNGMNGVGCDQLEAVEKVGKPLAIVQGNSDPFVNLQYLRDISYGSIWGGGPHFMRGGHAPHWHFPAEFNCWMLRFLLD